MKTKEHKEIVLIVKSNFTEGINMIYLLGLYKNLRPGELQILIARWRKRIKYETNWDDKYFSVMSLKRMFEGKDLWAGKNGRKGQPQIITKLKELKKWDDKESIYKTV